MVPGFGLMALAGVCALSARGVASGQNGALVRLQSTTPGVAQVGNINITGTHRAGAHIGGGAGLTDVNASFVGSFPNTALGRVNGPMTYSGINTFSNPANSFAGIGTNLAALSASAFTTGTVNDLRLSTDVALNTGAQTIDGLWTFNSNIIIPTGAGLGKVLISDSVGNVSWQTGQPTPIGTAGGDLSGTYPNPTLFTINTSLQKVSGGGMFALAGGGSFGIGVNPPTAKLDVMGSIRMLSQDLLIRGSGDVNHGVGWYGPGRPFGSYTGDGPVLYGYGGGGLAVHPSTQQAPILRWTPGSSTITTPVSSGDLSVQSNDGGGSWIDLSAPGGGKTWNLISSGVNNGEGAGKFLIRNATDGFVAVSFDPVGRMGVGVTVPSSGLDVHTNVQNGVAIFGSHSGAAPPLTASIGVIGGTAPITAGNTTNTIGVRGFAGTVGTADVGWGLVGTVEGPSFINYGIYGEGGGTVGYFPGAIYAVSASSGIKSFLIDHPLDPTNRYLEHSSVESAERMNLYRGTIRTDAKGYAVVSLPNWFAALNRNIQYSLTVVADNPDADFVDVMIARPLKDGMFIVRSSRGTVQVDYMVTGERHDPASLKYPLVPERDKIPGLTGKYLIPEAYGHGPEMRMFPTPGSGPVNNPPTAASKR